MNNQYSIIIVAGGRGSRFGSSTPKQFLPLGNSTVLAKTVEQFINTYPTIQVILVLPKQHIETGKNVLSKFKGITFVEGGSERFHSVQNGLAAVHKNATVIGIHDGVRPLVNKSVIKNTFETAETNQTAIPVLPIDDSMRMIQENNSIHVNRANYVRIQTPQCFQANILRECYEVDFSNQFTDDASVVQAKGYKINLVAGNKENIKITTPPDLKLAEFYLSDKIEVSLG